MCVCNKMNLQAGEVRIVRKTQTNSCTTLEHTSPVRIHATESCPDELHVIFLWQSLGLAVRTNRQVTSLRSLVRYVGLRAMRSGYVRPAFLKLWSADHKWSSGSAVVVLLD